MIFAAEPPVLSVLAGFAALGIVTAITCLIWLAFGPTGHDEHRDDQ